MHPSRLFKIAWVIGSVVWGFAAAGAADSAQLKLVVIISRHGVRSPTAPVEDLAKYSDQAWPQWPVAPGMLTEHGRALMVQMGKYYGARYRADGLLGDGAIDPSWLYASSDDVPRTIATAKALTLGITGQEGTPVEILQTNFSPVRGEGDSKRPAKANAALIDEAVQSRFGDDLPGLIRAYRTQFDDLNGILGGKGDWISASPSAISGSAKPRPTGPVAVASSLVEDLVLEYTEGMPSVGWGRLTRKNLADCYLLHALQFDYTARTFVAAQAQESTLAHRIVSSLQQAASGQEVHGALGPPATRLALVVAHDTNIARLAGLMGLSWTIDGLAQSPTLPGGALVFELWQHGAERFGVRGYYMAQTLDQMRQSQPLDLRSPPAVAVLMLPGGTTKTDHEAPLSTFEAELAKVIDRRFVAGD